MAQADKQGTVQAVRLPPKMPKRKTRGENVVKLQTRLKYQELALRYGDPMEFGFLVMSNPEIDLSLRLYAMRAILPYGEQRQQSIKIDPRLGETVTVVMEQGDMLADDHPPEVPELIGVGRAED